MPTTLNPTPSELEPSPKLSAPTMPPVGAQGEARWVVTSEHTAAHVGSGKIAVLATPIMVNLIEAAALAAVEPGLSTGHQSLGTLLNITHTAATPVGMEIYAVAKVTAVEGRTVRLQVDAFDAVERIGGGVHERVVVSVARFDQRVAAKIARLSDKP